MWLINFPSSIRHRARYHAHHRVRHLGRHGQKLHLFLALMIPPLAPARAVPEAAVATETRRADGRLARHSAMCLWGGKRLFKATVVNGAKQKRLSKKMATSRLQRVQEAAKQLQVNKEAETSQIQTGDSAPVRTVLHCGGHYAFAMEIGRSPELWFGRLALLQRKDGSVLMSPLLLDDAKKEDVRLVCSAWFEDSSDGTLVLGNVRDPTRYSAWSCFGSVDLALVPGSIDTFKFVDETHRRDLTAALELTVAGSTQRDCVAEVPVVQAESAAAAQARREAAEFMRAEKARESQSRDVREVERAPGKRRATRPVLN